MKIQPNLGHMWEQAIAYVPAGHKRELTYEYLKEYQIQMSEQISDKQRLKDEREARIAKALRDNLRRRKTAQKQMKLKPKN